MPVGGLCNISASRSGKCAAVIRLGVEAVVAIVNGKGRDKGTANAWVGASAAGVRWDRSTEGVANDNVVATGVIAVADALARGVVTPVATTHKRAYTSTD
jgi:hypothetical protein